MGARYFILSSALFAAAAIATPAAAIAPVQLGQNTAGPSLDEQTAALWPQFKKTADAIDMALVKARADKDASLSREQLKAMITLRLKLREMAGRKSLAREDLTGVLSDLKNAQVMTGGERLAFAFGDFRLQNSQIQILLNGVLATMEETNTSLLLRQSA